MTSEGDNDTPAARFLWRPEEMILLGSLKTREDRVAPSPPDNARDGHGSPEVGD